MVIFARAMAAEQARFVLAHLSGEARLENGGERYQNQVHRDDMAAALMLLATLLNERGIVNVTDKQPHTQREACAWLAANWIARSRPSSASLPSENGARVTNVSPTKSCALRFAEQA